MKAHLVVLFGVLAVTIALPSYAQGRGAGVRFVGKPQGNRGVTVTPTSRPPAGYRAAGRQPANGRTLTNFLHAKAGIGANGRRGFYTGSYGDFVAGRGVVRKR